MRGAAWLESVRTEHVLEEFLPAVLCSLFALWSPMPCQESLPAQLVNFFNLLVYHTGTVYLQLCTVV